MNRLSVIALALSAGLLAGTAAAAQSLSAADYKSAKEAISAQAKSAHAACASSRGNARDICKAEATGKEKVARAELEERRAPGSRSHYEVSAARAKADYAVAREKCDNLSAGDKRACVEEARTKQEHALAAGKAERRSAERNKPVASAAAEPAAAGTGKGESAGEYVDDSVITTKVKAAMLEESSLVSSEINVTTYKGTVQLTGFVRSRTDINKAVQVARAVRGVTSVKDAMVVKGQQ